MERSGLTRREGLVKTGWKLLEQGEGPIQLRRLLPPTLEEGPRACACMSRRRVVALFLHWLRRRPGLLPQERRGQSLHPALAVGTADEQMKDDAAPVGCLQPAGEEVLDLSLPEVNHRKTSPYGTQITPTLQDCLTRRHPRKTLGSGRPPPPEGFRPVAPEVRTVLWTDCLRPWGCSVYERPSPSDSRWDRCSIRGRTSRPASGRPWGNRWDRCAPPDRTSRLHPNPESPTSRRRVAATRWRALAPPSSRPTPQHRPEQPDLGPAPSPARRRPRCGFFLFYGPYPSLLLGRSSCGTGMGPPATESPKGAPLALRLSATLCCQSVSLGSSQVL